MPNDNEQTVGTIEASDLVMRTHHVGDAGAPIVYELMTASTSAPIVKSVKTGKYFILSWTDIIKLAQQAGIDD